MDLEILLQFKKVAELEHMTNASKALMIAQPALSRNISMLEKKLDTPLFDRVGKNIKLNQQGAVVLHHANRILDEIEMIKSELLNLKNSKNNSVNISMFAATKLLPDIIVKFNQLHPEITLKITQENINSRQQHFDLKIFSSPFPNNSEFGHTLIRESVYIALPKTHPLHHKTALEISDLKTLDFICMPKGKSLRRLIDNFCSRVGFTPNIVFECETPDLTRELIATGVGASFIPTITWAGIKPDNIVVRPLKNTQLERYINLHYNAPQYTNEATKTVIEFMIQYFKSLQNRDKISKSRLFE